MVSLMSLWLPILLSAVAVFILSSLVHTVFGYHNSDYRKLPAEDDVMRALAPFNVPAGEYMYPHPHDGSSMKDPVFVEKRTRGPAGFMTVFPPGIPSMGPMLGQWFVLNLVISLFAAYLASRALAPGAQGAEVFRVTATVSFLSYGMAHVSNAIWFAHSWGTTMKQLFDALLYGAVTGAVFLWLWPA